MPTQHSLRSHQQSRPRRLQKAIAKGRQQHSVARVPAYPFDLAFQDLNVTPQHQNFGLEAGLIAATRRDQVDHDTKLRVDQRSQHTSATC
jgi:nucleotidyltransferase/DNA polymerase involved in DNA repair